MTLLELCDKLGATLIMKRLPIKISGVKAKYSVYIQGARLYKDYVHLRCADPEIACITGIDVNKALYVLCDKVSNKYIKCGCREFQTDKVEKGRLAITGVW